jgi:hypothetical protein
VPDGPSGGAGRAVVWLDAVVAEQAAQAVKLAAQILVLRNKSLLGIWRFAVGAHPAFQPPLIRDQVPFPVAQRLSGWVSRSLVLPDLRTRR